MTYSFVAAQPGTFLYESGGGGERRTRLEPADPGPDGPLRRPHRAPGLGAKFAYDRADSRFNPDTEFLALLSEIDPYLNAAVLKGKTFNFNTYHPRYWLINGRGFPDSIADNFAAWLPSQPYGSLAAIHPNDKYLADGSPGPQHRPAVLSWVGTEDYPFHPHGNNGKVIGRDGAAARRARRPGHVVRRSSS